MRLQAVLVRIILGSHRMGWGKGAEICAPIFQGLGRMCLRPLNYHRMVQLVRESTQTPTLGLSARCMCIAQERPHSCQ